MEDRFSASTCQGTESKSSYAILFCSSRPMLLYNGESGRRKLKDENDSWGACEGNTECFGEKGTIKVIMSAAPKAESCSWDKSILTNLKRWMHKAYLSPFCVAIMEYLRLGILQRREISLAHSSAESTVPASASGEVLRSFHLWQRRGGRRAGREVPGSLEQLVLMGTIEWEPTHYPEDSTKPFLRDPPPWLKNLLLSPIPNIADQISP